MLFKIQELIQEPSIRPIPSSRFQMEGITVSRYLEAGISADKK